MLDHERSALITSVGEPGTANFVFWWPLYADGETVRVQHHVLFLSEHPEFELDRWREGLGVVGFGSVGEDAVG